MGPVDTVEWTCVLCGHHIQYDWVEQSICIRFCIKLAHSSMETTQMIQKAAAMGTGDCQFHHDNVPAHTSCLVQNFLMKHKITQAPLPPRFSTLQLLNFPKTKITFEREKISDHWWDSGKHDGATDGDWENCVRSQGAYFEGDWDIIVLCTMFLVSCLFFNKCLSFP